MAGTMLEYLNEYGNITFFEEPVNEVDSLILSQFAYLKFDGLVPTVHENKRSVTLKELAEHEDYEKLFADTRYEKPNRALLEGMLASKRFGKLKMNCYINIVETEWETQFSAITFLLEDGTIYVVYRGTDETIVGWKEDFNMTFLSPVPGQAYSVKYLNMVLGKLNCPFYMGGHSKGGNLAMYAAMKCSKEMQRRIVKVYNMDGPGFRPEVLESVDYEGIKDKIIKILPHSSLVGVIFEYSTDYRLVKSKAIGLLQHDPYSWLVKDGRFIDAGPIYEGHKFRNTTLNEWILSQDEESLRTFVDTLYKVISASEKDNLIDFAANWNESVSSMRTALKEVDEQTEEVIKAIFKDLVTLTQEKIKDELLRGQKKLLGTFKRKKENEKTEESL